MKRAYIFLLIGLTAILFSFKPKGNEEVTWYDWNTGYPLAAKENKLILVDVYTNWCGWCKKMDRDTYSDKDIAGTLNKQFIAIKLNPEKTDVTYKIDTLTLNGYQLMNVLTQGERSGFPTTVILNPRLNQVLHKEAGYQDAPALKQTLNEALGVKPKGKKKK